MKSNEKKYNWQQIDKIEAMAIFAMQGLLASGLDNIDLLAKRSFDRAERMLEESEKRYGKLKDRN